MNKEKSVSEAIEYRRSVRIFDADKSIDPLRVKECIAQSTLAPTSSNMQLWEFHHIISEDIKNKIDYKVFKRSPKKNLPKKSSTQIKKQITIPFRIDLAGGWMDQFYINKSIGF